MKNNREFCDLLINCILNEHMENINITEIFKKKEFYSKNDVSIISVIKKYLSTLFKDKITKLIFSLEKDYLLPTLVFNQNYIDDLNNVDYFQGDGLIQENNKNEIILENEEEIYLYKKEEIVNAIRDGENEIREDKNEIKDGNIKDKISFLW